ncbi:unnamed protein product [Cladocopium goreaui]|uniref:Uncharacterized protein n=1 Tax=Cladocopium goreaui TaxID=2562237 RepID=A0A9P1CSY7_9DINO|nr:unnamed protein product [Cladocopium goreaui]
MSLDVYRLSPARYEFLRDIGREVFRSQSSGSGTLVDAVASVDIAGYIGRRGKLFRTQDACETFLHKNLKDFTDLAQFTRVMTPEFAGALHELEAQRVERPKVFAIGALLEHGLSIRLITEGKDAELEEVARRLEELLSDWKKGVRGKTSGTAFASWQKTLSAARHFVNLFQGVVERRQDKRARLEDFPSQVGLWHKPVNFVELGRGLRVLFGEDDVRSIVVFLAQMYLLIRKLLELHRASELSAQDFSYSFCNVLGFGSWSKVMMWSCRANPRVQYRIGQSFLQDEVTFLNSCRLLRLHCVDSVNDPVQVQTRKNIMSCSTDCSAMDRSRTILRAVMVVHATRHYEFSSCIRNQTLLSPDQVLACFSRGHVDEGLVRRSTSEGRFMCGPASQVLELLGRPNVMDTFTGGVYHRDFEQAVLHFNALSGAAGIDDAAILDQVWDLIKGFKGFGGAGNCEGGNVKGFVAKNIVYQGLRNILHECGQKRAQSERFVSGLNPCKLVTVALQKRSCSRSEHKQFYKDVLVGLRGVRVQYGTGELCDFCGVDVMEKLRARVQLLIDVPNLSGVIKMYWVIVSEEMVFGGSSSFDLKGKSMTWSLLVGARLIWSVTTGRR